MLVQYTLKRLLSAIPTLAVISLIIFLILDLSPGDPMSEIPLNIPPEVVAKMRQTLGLGQPWYIRYLKWLYQLFIVEPSVLLSHLLGYSLSDTGARMISWQTKAPVFDLIAQRLPQTLWVVGSAFVLSTCLAIPIAAVAGFRPASALDKFFNAITLLFISMPAFVIGVVVLVLFAVELKWFPSVYNTRHSVVDFQSFVFQVKQMFMPVLSLFVQYFSFIGRYQRASVIENIELDYVKTARAKGVAEKMVLLKHILKNALLPVVTIVALLAPTIFAGAIVTEQVFKVNGLGQLLIKGIEVTDIPLVQTLSFFFAVLIVLFNILADALYAIIDPRIRYG